MKKNLKDALLKGLIFAKNTKLEQKDDLDLVQSNATYYNCACYLIFTKKEEINCENCLDSLIVEKSELPSEFYAAHITKTKEKRVSSFYATPHLVFTTPLQRWRVSFRSTYNHIKPTLGIPSS